MKRWSVVLVIVVIALVVVGVVVFTHKSSNNSMGTMNTNSSTSSSSTDSAVATNNVSIANFAFSPAKITVKKGTKVIWTNKDTTQHTVTSDSGNTMQSQALSNGDTYSVTFNSTGTFAYHCSFHSDMHGSVVVTD